ncbi:hypothetical protein AURANDRAFT_70910 [Aureococcus anophagefferens]|uniref:Uncharacterized protein n=1 Tax=Aureococcus anophagefferens TaxID=44056 RepID=F0XZR8_AURAN|nr:hypothetical protein AURANDRAFT_70910 [Aureococcus anophagefferens]EGB11391.1 hypothetical protein AURANDRAFT_70910 [Aureococcus anophagefferens]|eukprot:XP_009033763.1 hypothetical protein AURANDRAFT_70910 [Aureococcus anophagefferens]
MVSLVPPSLAGSAQVAPARDGDASPAPRPKTKAASRVVGRVLGVAALGSALLFYGAVSAWTSDGSRSFDAGAGALLGLACAAVPYSAVGLLVAYGPQTFDARNRAGFCVAVVAPALVVVGLVVPVLAMRRSAGEARDLGAFFGMFAVVLAGFATHGTWYLVARANASPLVPPAAAGMLGTLVCVLVLFPLGVALPLVAFRKGGAAGAKAVAGLDGSKAAPPPGVAACVLPPLACVLVLSHPVLRVAVLGWPLRGKGWCRPPFAALDAALFSCLAGAAALCALRSPPSQRGAVALLVVATAGVTYAAAALAGRGDGAEAAWRRATRLLAPLFFGGLACVELGRRRAAYAPLGRALFGAFGALLLAALAAERYRREPASRRVRAATRAVALAALPWWAATVADGGGALGYAAVASAAVPLAAAAADAWAARRESAPPAPPRADALRVAPHALLVFVLCYVGVVLFQTRLRAGGRGFFGALVCVAPLATWAGLEEAARREREPARRLLKPPKTLQERALSACWCPGVAVVAWLFVAGRRGDLLKLDRSLSGELQAAALCLVAAAPACAAAWDAAFLGAALWRGGAAAAGRRAALDNLAYYAALLRDGAADGGDDGAAGDDAAPARSLYDRWCGADVSADEAGPFFSTMVCCLVLVPFGVLGPLFFLAKADRVPLVSKSQLMGALVAAVFALVLILTTAANASMDRLKNEARAKVAAYDLRLALRAERVVANPAVARLLVEARDHHAAGAEAAFRRDRPARRRATLGDHAARRVADAADAALREDLRRAAARHGALADAAERRVAAAAVEAASDAGKKDERHDRFSARVTQVLAWGDREIHREKGKLQAWGDQVSTRLLRHPSSPRDRPSSAGRRPAPAPADDDYAKALEQRPGDESLVFWRRTKREPSCMDLEPFGKIRNEVRRKHDQRVAEAAAAARKAREARGAAPSPDRPTARAAVARAVELLPDEAALSLEAPPWLRDRFRRCGACLGRARDDDVSDDAAVTPARRRRRFEAGDAAGCAAARTAARGAVAAACDVFARAAFPGAPAAAARRAVDDVERALDDELRGGGRRAAEALDALEARAVALARWRLVRDGVPLLVERRWRLAPPTKAATAAYRAGLLPRAFAGRARANGGAAMRAGDWRGFLEDAGVLGDGGPRALGELKADLIFTSLARDADGDDARADKVLGYGQFRQAMRQAAVALYPQLPEADALKLLGQKHIFPKATLAPEAAARQAGVLAGGGPGRPPRLLDVLRRDGGVPRGGAALAASQHALRAARDAAGETMGEVRRGDQHGAAASRAGAAFGAASREARAKFRAARERTRAAVKLSDAERAGGDDSSDDEAVAIHDAVADAERAIAEETATKQRRRLCSLARLKASLLEALEGADAPDATAQELALLKAGAAAHDAAADADAAAAPPSDWHRIVDVAAASLRRSADAAAAAERSHAARRSVKVTRNVDNGFAFLDLFIEVATFCSVGLKGAGGFAWGTVRRCEFDPRGCAPPETAGQARRTRLSRLASLPLMTLDSVDASQAFWVCAGLCLITPPYLLRAVRQARAQTVGLGPGGAKLKLFSLPWCYFQGIKVFAAGLAPVMTTLFSALVCDTCEPSPRFLSRIAAVRCASRTHAVYVAAALAGILCYYPLLTYVQPQLQFKSKALDLKFEPTYLTNSLSRSNRRRFG